MENHFYHIRGAPLSAFIFITDVRTLHNGSYANAVCLNVSVPNFRLNAVGLSLEGTLPCYSLIDMTLDRTYDKLGSYQAP